MFGRNLKLRSELLEQRCLLTSVSPVPLTNVSSATQSAEFGDFHSSGDLLFFELEEKQLWVTEGTLESTRKVADVVPEGEMVHALDVDFFDVQTDTGFSIWQTDGTAGGTFEVLPDRRLPQTTNTYFDFNPIFEAFGLGFVAIEESNGCEVWVLGGEGAGATRLEPPADVGATFGETCSVEFQATSERVFFRNWQYPELRLYSVEPEKLQVELIHGRARVLAATIEDELFFRVTRDDVTHIYKTDGKQEATELLGSYQRLTGVRVLDDRLIFMAVPLGADPEEAFLWTFDRSNGETEKVLDFGFGGYGATFWSAITEDVLLFDGNGFDDPSLGNGFWRTDGTAEGTFRLLDGSWIRDGFVRVGKIDGWTYFINSNKWDSEVFRTDGVNTESLDVGLLYGTGFETDNGGIVLHSSESGYGNHANYVNSEGRISSIGEFREFEIGVASHEWYATGRPKSPTEHPVSATRMAWYEFQRAGRRIFTSSETIDLFNVGTRRRWLAADRYGPPNLLDDAIGRRDVDPLFFSTEGALFAADNSRVQFIQTGQVDSWVPIDGAVLYVMDSLNDMGFSLHVSNGTTEGTLGVVAESGEVLSPRQLHKWKDSAITVADTVDGGTELWLLQPTASTVENELPVRVRNTFDVIEGRDLRLSVSSPVDDVTYRWDINNDGQFGDVVGEKPVISWNEMPSRQVDRYHPVSVEGTDPSGRTTISRSAFRILNLRPTELSVVAPDTVVAGKPFVVTASATDFGPLDFRVNSNNPFQTDPEISVTIDHPGKQRLTVYARDNAGLLSSISVEVDVLAPSDIDGNRHVNFADFLILSTNFGASDARPSMGDINEDGTVDHADFLLLQKDFGLSYK